MYFLYIWGPKPIEATFASNKFRFCSCCLVYSFESLCISFHTFSFIGANRNVYQSISRINAENFRKRATIDYFKQARNSLKNSKTIHHFYYLYSLDHIPYRFNMLVADRQWDIVLFYSLFFFFFIIFHFWDTCLERLPIDINNRENEEERERIVFSIKKISFTRLLSTTLLLAALLPLYGSSFAFFFISFIYIFASISLLIPALKIRATLKNTYC